MTSDELRAKFEMAYKIIAAERKMREYVFRDNPIVREAKLAEVDRLLSILVEIKDLAKLQVAAEYEQAALLDVPRKADYS